MKRLAWLALFLLASCGREGAVNPTPSSSNLALQAQEESQDPALAPTYTSLSANIFQPDCIKCHGGPKPAAGIDLSDYQMLIKSSCVVAGNPAKSQLYVVVQNGKMPKGGTPLSAQQVQAISDWITNGMPQ